MAKLYFKYGAMGSCKTINAITTVYNYKEKGQKALFAKTELDKRDGKFVVRSRIGLESECVLLGDMLAMDEAQLKEYDIIVVDEAQFATKEQIDALAHIVDFLDIPVICYGLRADFRLQLFEGSERLLAIADEIEELKTMCWCGKKATCNVRYDENGIVRDGEQIVLGSNNNYTSLCRKHYMMGLLEKPQ